MLVAGALGYFAFGGDVGLWDDVRFFRFIWHMRLLCSHSGARPARRSCSRRYSFSDRWARFDGGPSTRKLLLSPPPISPIATSSEEQKEHEDNENEIHIFLQNVWQEIFPPAHVGAE